jgi:hypothetical protein
MRGYFGLGQLSATEKQDILNQHKSLYNGYQTMQPKVSNEQPLYVYDFAGDKDGMVVNNKGEVKKYTNMGINEQVKSKNMCEQCGGVMKENVCEQCGPSEEIEENVGKLDDIYKVKDLNLTKGDFDYVEGGGNDYGTFEKAHHMKKMKNEQSDDDDYMDYESSYTEDGMDDPDNEDDGFEDMNLDEIEVEKLNKGGKYKYNPKYKPEAEDEVEFMDRIDYDDDSKPHYQFSGKKSNYLFPDKHIEDFISSLDEQGGNADDMDVDDVEDTYNFVSNGPGDVYPVNEDDMYGYEPEKTYETMESAWADEEMTEITNSLKLKSLKKTMEKEKEGFKSPLKQSKNLKQNRLFGSHISPDIRREANSIAKMMGDDVEVDVVKNTFGSDEDDLYQRISLNFQILGGKLLATITINSSGEVYIRGEFPQKVERRLDRLVDKIQSEELNSDVNEQDVSGSQGIYGDMEKAYDFDSDGPGKGGPYQEFSYESELDEEDHSDDEEWEEIDDEEWEEIDVDMVESFITQKNKITEMFNRIGKFN